MLNKKNLIIQTFMKKHIISKEHFFLKEDEIIIIVANKILNKHILAFKNLANNERNNYE